MEETNSSGQTLLMLAAKHGQYELVATAINLGADVDKLDTTDKKMTALKYSQQNGFVLHFIALIDSPSVFVSILYVHSLISLNVQIFGH